MLSSLPDNPVTAGLAMAPNDFRGPAFGPITNRPQDTILPHKLCSIPILAKVSGIGQSCLPPGLAAPQVKLTHFMSRGPAWYAADE
jgi:hypothetical protein